MPNIKFTTDDIFEAAALYYQYGTYTEASRQMDGRVSPRLIKFWHDGEGKHGDTFREGLAKAAQVADKKLSAKFLKVAMGCTDEMIARLEDPETRSKIQFRELSMTGGIYHDKRQVMEGKATSIRGPSGSEMERIKGLENQLAERYKDKGLAEVHRFPRKVEDVR